MLKNVSKSRLNFLSLAKVSKTNFTPFFFSATTEAIKPSKLQKVSSAEVKNFPKPKAPLSLGVKYLPSNLLWTCGCIGATPDGKLDGVTIEEQGSQAIQNMRQILHACGSDMDKIIKITVYIKDMDNFDRFNKVYVTFFEGIELPARTCVEVARLPRDCMVELECIAYYE